MDLLTFGRARIDEDERWARSPECDQDPDRLLREVAAKRRILERHQPRLIEGRDGDGVEREAWFCAHDDEPWPCADARDAVAPYSDHEQFREEWKP